MIVNHNHHNLCSACEDRQVINARNLVETIHLVVFNRDRPVVLYIAEIQFA